MDEAKLLEKLRRIEALYAGATTSTLTVREGLSRHSHVDPRHVKRGLLRYTARVASASLRVESDTHEN